MIVAAGDNSVVVYQGSLYYLSTWSVDPLNMTQYCVNVFELERPPVMAAKEKRDNAI